MFDNQSEHAFRRLSNLFFSMGDVFENQRGTVQTFVPYYGYVKTRWRWYSSSHQMGKFYVAFWNHDQSKLPLKNQN